MSEIPSRDAAKQRFRDAVNRYVESIGSVLSATLTDTFHEDYIDGLTREIGYGLEDLLFDDDEFPWKQHASAITKLSEAEIGAAISALAIATLACRAVREGTHSLLNDASIIYPGVGPFADEIKSFISGGMFTAEGKISNVMSRTGHLMQKWIQLPAADWDKFFERVVALSKASESGALHHANKGKAVRGFADHVSTALPQAFQNVENARKKEAEGSGCGCVICIIVLVGIAYWWFR